MLWQSSEDATMVEAVKKQQQEWSVTLLKSKIAAKQMRRKEFDSMSFAWRAKYVKSGGRVTD